MAKILLIEDDPSVSLTVSEWLRDQGHVVEVATDGEAGLDLLKFYSYDVAIVDWELPKLSGPQICHAYRDMGGNARLLMLTGKSALEDKEQGLDAGADDYLTKPFAPRELSARLRAILRRPASRVENLLTAKDLQLDTTTHEVKRAGKTIHLMPKEFALLEFLMRNPNQPFSADAILDRVWPSASDVSTETIKVNIARLRKKIDTENSATLIETVHGVGYKLLS